MFESPALRVVLATVHIPLADVPRALTRRSDGAHDRADGPRAAAFRRSRAPRLAVAGLNPHAGEHGLMGREDDAVIAPAIAACARGGHRRVGSAAGRHGLPARHARRVRRRVACYHDQGLIPVKLLAFGQAVNVTLGLPIVRTSVDHGTAFDIAGRGVADAGSDDRGRPARRPAWRAHRDPSDLRVRTLMLTRRRATEAQARIVAENRKALHDYHILETFEAGVVLQGTEVKSIREGRVNLRDSFARVEAGEIFVYNVHISRVLAPRVCRPRADAPAQAPAASPGDPEADRQDRREGHDARAAAAVFQGRQDQARDQPGQGQAGARQARSDPEARSGPGDTRGREDSAAADSRPFV